MSKATTTKIFPQANSLAMVSASIDMMNGSEGIRASLIADVAGMSARQGAYYAKAVQFLGLATYDAATKTYKLNKEGVRVKRMGTKKRFEYIASVTAENPVFAKTYLGKNVTKTDLKRSGLDKMSESTRNRRLSTVQAWKNSLQDNLAVAVA